MTQIDWQIVKQSLHENFIQIDFNVPIAFPGVDFDNLLEIVRYVLNSKQKDHAELVDVLESLQSYASNENSKNVLDTLVSKFEPYTKKILAIIGRPFVPSTKSPEKGAALGWCIQELLNKLPTSISKIRMDDFYETVLDGKTSTPAKPSSSFVNLLTDGSRHGSYLHQTYHLRNSSIHDNPAIRTRDIPGHITACINSYLYFTAKFYNGLVSSIPSTDLTPSSLVEIKNLASLGGGAYNPKTINEVVRDGIIKTIEKKLESLNILSLVGPNGVGKTNILFQFIKKHPDNCITYFIDGNDKSTYSILAILKDLSNQISFKNSKREITEDLNAVQLADESFLQRYFNGTRLRTAANTTDYIIIDGLDEIPLENQQEIQEQILDLLPLTRDNVKILMTGNIPTKLKKHKSELWEIPQMSSHEAKQILGKSFTENEFHEINKLCQNNAGRLVFIRELLTDSDIQTGAIINNITTRIDDLFTYIWNRFINKDDKILGLVLAIIAYEGKKYTLAKIAQILSEPQKPITEEILISAIQEIPFIRRNARGTYEFIFNDLNDFAKKRLASYKKIIDESLIRYLILNSDTKESLVNLPELYKETGRIDDLIKLLGADKWKQLLKTSESISDVNRVSSIALQAINEETENKNIPTLLKYSVLKSALKELQQVSIWQYEIAANLSLDDDLNAINLANLAFLKEDRLKLFASIAKTYSQKKRPIPDSISNAINELFQELNFKNIGTDALDLASLLMYANPKLTFQLIEQISGNVADNDNAFDWAMAQMSLDAYANLHYNEDLTKEDVNSKVYSKIRNPKIKEFADAIVFSMENQKFEDIIAKINEVDSTGQKLFLLQNWIINNIEDSNIPLMVDMGIDLVVNKSDYYVPKASDFKIFAAPLPFLKDEEKALYLSKRIEAFLTSLTATSSNFEIFNIKLLIAQTIYNFNYTIGEEKLSLVYEEITKISDLSVKSTCLASYASFASKIKKKFPESDIDIYAEVAKDHIEGSIDEILNKTASHFEIVRSIIINLVKVYPQNTIDICDKLNKSIDRDNGYLEALSHYIKVDLNLLEIEIIDQIITKIVDIDIKKLAISEIVDRLTQLDDKAEIPEALLKYFDLVDDIIDPSTKCFLYISILSVFEKLSKDNAIISDKLISSWAELEIGANKIELGFEIAYRASFLENKTIAQEFLKLSKVEKDRTELLLDSPNTASVYYNVIDLAIRSFSGLVVKAAYDERDLTALESIIEAIPSDSQQIILWSTLILRIAPKVEKAFGKKLIDKYILPKIHKVKSYSERIEVILNIAPVLYLADSELTYLKELPSDKLRDITIARICKYLISNCPPNELCDDNEEGFSIAFPTLRNILELVRKMRNDYFIAFQIDEVRKSINSGKTNVSSQQIVEIQNQIDLISSEKLPDMSNIRHDGYKILLKAFRLSIQRQVRKEDWEGIVAKVETIPNLSDKIYLWISIATMIPNKSEFDSLRQDLITMAADNAYLLPSFLDTVQRLSMIFLSLTRKEVTGISLKHLLARFVDAQRKQEVTPKLREQYRDILDVAYTTDPGTAKVFINLFDDDPARHNTGAYLNNYLNYLEFQTKLNKISNDVVSERVMIETNPHFFRQLIDKKLARLNASKNIDDSYVPKELVYQLNIAADKSIYDSQSAFAYFIERLNIRYEKTDEAKKILKKSFKELLEICEIIKMLSVRNADKIKSLFDILSNVHENSIDTLETLTEDLGSEKIAMIKKLIAKEFTTKEISEMLSIEKVKIEVIGTAI